MLIAFGASVAVLPQSLEKPTLNQRSSDFTASFSSNNSFLYDTNEHWNLARELNLNGFGSLGEAKIKPHPLLE